MSFPVSSTPLPPRHFWRRCLAYLIDVLLVGMLVGGTLMVVSGVIYGQALPSDISKCHNVAETTEVLDAMKLGPDAKVTAASCPLSDLLHGERATIIAFAEVQEAGGWKTHLAFFTRDTSGLHPLDLFMRSIVPNLLTWLALPVAFAVLSANGRRSLGKKAMALIVKRVDDGFPSFGRALLREALKLLPAPLLTSIWVINAIQSGNSPFGAIEAVLDRDYGTLIRILEWALGLQALLIAWWLGPFLVWRGQTWYDRLAGTKVVRT
jgi:uncharacterized RDD family membrane protein YckC